MNRPVYISQCVVILLAVLLVAHLSVAARAQEGPSADSHDPSKSLLWELTIEGNKAVSLEDLSEAIASQPSSHVSWLWWTPFFNKHEFDPVEFQADQKRIIHLYQRRGYYQARIDRNSVEPCGDVSGRVCARIRIEEGEPTRIKYLAVKVGASVPQRSADELAQAFGMKNGDIFDHDRYVRAKTALEAYLRERSYPKPELKGDAAYSPDVNQVIVTLDVKPGTAARVGDVKFVGLEEVRPEDAAARLPIKSGVGYDPKVFDEAQELLSNLDVFRSIELDLVPRPGDPGVVDVVYRVHEKPLKTLQFGAGVRIDNSRHEARVRAEWVNRNFYRHLRTFDVRLEPRYAVLPSIFNPQQYGWLGTFDLTLRQPAFLGPRQDWLTSVGFDSDLEQGYRWFGPRFRTGLDRRINREISLSFGYTFRYLRFYDVDVGAASSPVSTALIPVELLFTDNYRLGFVDQFMRWDNRDNVLEPHLGSLIQVSLAESAHVLGSGFTYFRIAPELRHYFPMTRRATLAARVYAGRIVEIDHGATPITERYYGGGSSDHRGFAYHRLSPQSVTSDGRLVPIGGNYEFLVSLEERINLTRLGDNWIIGAIFVDAGDVVPTPAEIDYKHLHYAVGTGLRYNSPLGVLRADVGFRVNRLGPTTDGRPNPDPGDRYAVHISFGEAF